MGTLSLLVYSTPQGDGSLGVMLAGGAEQFHSWQQWQLGENAAHNCC